MSGERVTESRKINLERYSDGQLRALFRHHGLRLTEPLLARRIVVVEGPSDAVILSRLIARRCGCTTDQMDMVIVPARGAHHVVELSKLLQRLDVDWRAVFDWDVAIGGQTPLTRDELSDEEKQAVSEAIDTVQDSLSDGSRGNGVVKSLQKVLDEIRNGRPAPTLYDESKLKVFLENGTQQHSISKADRKVLVDALESKNVTDFQPILNKYNAWLWRNDIEHAVMFKDESTDIVERVLVEENIISAPLTGVEDRKTRLRRTLHGEVQKHPLVLRRVVDELDEEQMFNYTQMNKAVRWLRKDFP